ncbi:pteridine reductase [Shewanella gelidii]|uniref:Pteridine reductase n=1 Tax=Shewanella gelidii TaxID=1642821 RepID=A0A917JU59_9GAMM|nr:pteridine reductase [Shewanella gelidii]MCL1098010.1 pteridine reductase [Shewanella gelidii]GGI85428.1 pteridine reductase [Shewanella gelidii]
MDKWALITGAAKRVGAEIAEQLHQDGFNIVIHYHHSGVEAQALCDKFNQRRDGSALLLQSSLDSEEDIKQIIDAIESLAISLHILVNNASSFHKTTIEHCNFRTFQQTLTTNLVAPYLLSVGLRHLLSNNQGTIINLVDIHAKKPLQDHGLYSISKAGLEMATLSLAQELAPDIRVNGVAPGAILWPENSSIAVQRQIQEQIPLNKLGSPNDIANAIKFLVNASYITGQIITVDGGRSICGYQGAKS